MRHAIAAALMMAATAVSAAQTSSTVQTTPQKPVTITGCLSAGADQNSFTLTTAIPAKAAPVGTSGSMESTEASGQKPDATTVSYTVEPIATVNLEKHVGHTVEVTGVEPEGDAAVTLRTSGKRLTVNSVKEVANECRVQK